MQRQILSIVFNNGTVWLVCLCTDKKCKKVGKLYGENTSFSIATRNVSTTIPFIQSMCVALGWMKVHVVPVYIQACSWFDGDVGKIQNNVG